jgi:heme/copper-type cytochrome/quinol oxidase subunit 1
MAVVEHQPALSPPPWTAALHDWLTTVDHKKIGILYVASAVLFLIVGGVEALLIRTQLLWPRARIIEADTSATTWCR